MPIYYKALSSGLYLVQQTIDSKASTATAPRLNHIAIIDCSGSMVGDLPKIREQLKRRLPSILNNGDTFTLIWFSGRGEWGTLLEMEEIAGLKDLQDVHKVIDRWLRPVGLTGFKEPLAAALALAERCEKFSYPIALFFMTDGQDNQWPRAEILKLTAELKGRIASATFVEYGPYADRPMLAAMAQSAGGRHLVADDFGQYEPIFADAIQRSVNASPRVEVKIAMPPVGQLVFAITDGGIVTFAAEDVVTLDAWNVQSACVDAGIDSVFYLTDVKPLQGVRGNHHSLQTAAYAAMSIFALHARPDIIYPLLKETGDVRLINSFPTCFGKQRYSRFSADAKECAVDPAWRLRQGHDPNLVPKEDAFTILRLLEILQSDPTTRICLDHPAFEYSRISRRRVDADEVLTADERTRIAELSAQMEYARGRLDFRKIQGQISEILNRKRDALKFEADPTPDGYPIAGLVFHETRPNVSILVQKQGVVDLTSRFETMPPGGKAAVERRADVWAVPGFRSYFRTHIWRSYSIVADGLVHVRRLPVKISRKVWDQLATADVAMEPAEDGVTVIDLYDLPLLNRSMVRDVSLRDAIRLEYALIRLRAHQKVFKAVLVGRFPGGELSKIFAERFGEDGAAWLKKQGLTENGFAPPHTVSAESIDYITGRELEIKLSGFSKLPTVKSVQEKIAKIAAYDSAPVGEHKAKPFSSLTSKRPVLNGPEALMAEALEDIDRESRATGNRGEFQSWLLTRTQDVIKETRALLLMAARMKWAITVGQGWFNEFKTFTENTLEVEIQGVSVKGTADLREIEIKI